jgi:hypothetical protein
VSAQGVILEWLKASTVPAALLGVLVTFMVGSGNLRESQENRVADRFDKALARLASANARERVTGVFGLKLFLGERNPEHQRQALHYLVDAAGFETDPHVQDAIGTALDDLPKYRLAQRALDEGLKDALDRNRSLTAAIVRAWPDRRELALRELAAERDGPRKPSSLAVELWTRLRAEAGPFAGLPLEQSTLLHGSARAVSALARAQAKQTNFRDIYCEGCDFRGAPDLSGAHFDEAYLKGANFSGVRLRGAHFTDSDLSGARFDNANLQNADLFTLAVKASLITDPVSYSRVVGGGVPSLTCARLEGADLSGLPLVRFHKVLRQTDLDFTEFRLSARGIEARFATFDETTQLAKLGVTIETLINENTLNEDNAASAWADIVMRGGYQDPLRPGPGFEPIVWRAGQSVRISEYVFLEPKDGFGLYPWAAEPLLRALDNHAFRDLPVIKEFRANVRAAQSLGARSGAALKSEEAQPGARQRYCDAHLRAVLL